MVDRKLKIASKQSFFLFGPRGVGKSTFLQKWMSKKKETLSINLLDPEEEERFALRPNELIYFFSAHMAGKMD